ncbi:hypothetical protein ACHAXA_005942 [Cyclostephanos tholiformis]|uniref:Reverse transcriptase domain-containing protein n=1 Tax=Cyclostephanos tholiformis TaxID=382380 RepID=A0ABD3RHK1_9STRA
MPKENHQLDITARRKYPGRRIFASKIDFKSAFRRCNLSAATAIQCCTQLPAMDLILLYLRLTFGGCPCPNEWGAFSEPICDLATAILHDDLWKPAELHSPTQNLVPPPKPMEDNVPFGIGQELIVDIDVNPRGFNDVYIDDMIPLMVDIPGTDNLERCKAAALLAIHATARQNHPDEPIPREEMEARNKLSAEAGLEETKTILGWLIDFRRLIISLPSNKFIAWTELINKILTRGTSTAKELETTIGQLGHLSAIMPFVYHFLSRLRNLQRKATNRRTIDIPQDCHDNLNLMLSFLHKAHTGIDMNLIAFRRPTHIYRSDSCPYGLGGYSHEGFAWRFKLPENCFFRASNNLLQFIVSIITPWIDLISNCLRPEDCAKQQKAIPLCIIAEIGKRRTTKLQRAIGQLTAAAIFFAMHSCEYLKVTQAEKRRTDILRVRNLRFFRDGKLIEHSDPHLEFSDCISITFEMQKKDEKNDTITQQASGAVSMCPVRMATAIVRRIRSYKGLDNNTPISAFWRFNRIDHDTSAQVIAAMKDAITAIGEDILHIKKSEIGTHSIRSGAAMAMFLSDCSVCQIMMIATSSMGVADGPSWWYDDGDAFTTCDDGRDGQKARYERIKEEEEEGAGSYPFAADLLRHVGRWYLLLVMLLVLGRAYRRCGMRILTYTAPRSPSLLPMPLIVFDASVALDDDEDARLRRRFEEAMRRREDKVPLLVPATGELLEERRGTASSSSSSSLSSSSSPVDGSKKDGTSRAQGNAVAGEDICSRPTMMVGEAEGKVDGVGAPTGGGDGTRPTIAMEGDGGAARNIMDRRRFGTSGDGNERRTRAVKDYAEYHEPRRMGRDRDDAEKYDDRDRTPSDEFDRDDDEYDLPSCEWETYRSTSILFPPCDEEEGSRSSRSRSRRRRRRPRAVVHFVGGTLFGSYPRRFYGSLLEDISIKCDAVVVVTPIPIVLPVVGGLAGRVERWIFNDEGGGGYNDDDGGLGGGVEGEEGTDHLSLATRVQAEFNNAYRDVILDEYCADHHDNDDYDDEVEDFMRRVPIVGIGHSLGARIQAVSCSDPHISTRYLSMGKRKRLIRSGRDGMIYLGFANWSAKSSIPGVETLDDTVRRRKRARQRREENDRSDGVGRRDDVWDNGSRRRRQGRYDNNYKRDRRGRYDGYDAEDLDLMDVFGDVVSGVADGVKMIGEVLTPKAEDLEFSPTPDELWNDLSSSYDNGSDAGVDDDEGGGREVVDEEEVRRRRLILI